MNILGVGPLELFAIFIIAILVIGPNDLVKTARKVGQFIRKGQQSDLWQAIQGSRKAISRFSDEIISDSDLEEIKDELAELNSLRDRNKQTIEKQFSSSLNSPDEKTPKLTGDNISGI